MDKTREEKIGWLAFWQAQKNGAPDALCVVTPDRAKFEKMSDKKIDALYAKGAKDAAIDFEILKAALRIYQGKDLVN